MYYCTFGKNFIVDPSFSVRGTKSPIVRSMGCVDGVIVMYELYDITEYKKS